MAKKKIELHSDIKIALGLILGLLCISTIIAIISFLFAWEADQNQLRALTDKTVLTSNWLGKVGAIVGDLLVFKSFGIASIFIPILGAFYAFFMIVKKKPIFSFYKYTFILIFTLIWLPLFIGFISQEGSILGGVLGFEMYDFLFMFIGRIGVGLLLLFTSLIFTTIAYGYTPIKIFQACIRLFKNAQNKYSVTKDTAVGIKNTVKTKVSNLKTEKSEVETLVEQTRVKEENTETQTENTEEISSNQETKPVVEPEKHEVVEQTEEVLESSEEEQEASETTYHTLSLEEENEPLEPETEPVVEQNIKVEEEETKPVSLDLDPKIETTKKAETENDSKLEIQKPIQEEEVVSNDIAANLVKENGEYNPHLDLPMYHYPTIDLLKDYRNLNIKIDPSILEENKIKIVETLRNYKIGIAKISATIGPTVTLYEIVPEAGVRISKIKNLEDDIALSLAALGIRIIAPIPGKGTIGIEVPSSNPTLVSMRSAIASEKFNTTDMELPIAFGKTISNETYVADLTKMPHLLMAGATGQGKSVGLNAIITSLLYKKHPSELKFVLVDPKKVELTLYNRIERHFLAKLPDAEEAIITDNTKVINTVNSLCVEMDNRYELLKKALVRNIKEYNAKFKARKLNPNQGHQFLPYIVLIIDEFADLIMTSGKDVETPVARLAQLARAVGIHLIVATQRPSVNVITGLIKANFPARIAFRVTSKIDSRTILDTGGADQLIGKGDMLYSNGNDLVRLQCAFVDTPEVERMTEFIGHQKGYEDALLLPEYTTEEVNSLDVDLSDRDVLFEDAARVLVMAQQGSASLLQRKLKLGYNRAGRIIDQLETAGIVGPFEGSKARKVLVPDDYSLEQLLDNLK